MTTDVFDKINDDIL